MRLWHGMNRAEYLRFRRPYERVLRQLLLDLEFFVEDLVGINVHSITHRIKTFESALEKSKRLNLKIDEMQDIAGIRIIVATIDEVDVVSRFFSRKAYSKDLTIKSDQMINKKNGYRARHLVLEFSGHYSRSMHPAFVEVQILTLLQNTFNYISRAWLYKTERIFTEEWQADFKKLASDLTEIDQKIAKLQKQVIESSVVKGYGEPLTPLSYQKILAEIFGESVKIDDAVDSVQMLIDLGCDTNEKLQSFFSRTDVLELREQILEMKSETAQAFAKLVDSMSMSSFFMMFGLRFESAKELIEILNNPQSSNSSTS